MRFLILVLGVLLLGCDQAAEVVSNDLARVQAVPVGPNYVMVDGYKYGYERDTGEVYFVSYLGEKVGEYQFLEKVNEHYSVVYRLKAPYEFFESLEFNGRDFMSRSMQRLSPDLMIAVIFSDAKAGWLKVSGREAGGVLTALWINADNEPENYILGGAPVGGG